MRLRRAASSPCPGCRRVTKTVDGVCADCWAVKDWSRAYRPPPRTEPLLPLDWGDPQDLLLAVLAVAAVIAAVAYALERWI